VTGFLEGKTTAQIKEKWSEVSLFFELAGRSPLAPPYLGTRRRGKLDANDQSLFPTLKANWSVWIPVQLANMVRPPLDPQSYQSCITDSIGCAFFSSLITTSPRM
jgi:hypothetical protein